MDEVTEITDYIQQKTKSTGDIIWGNGFDENLDDKISVTIVATGFDEDHKEKGPSEPEIVTKHILYGDAAPIKEKRLYITEPELVTARRPEPEPEIPAVMESVQFSPEPELAEAPRTIEFTFDKPEPDFMPDPAETLVGEALPEVHAELTEPKVFYRPVAVSSPPHPAEPELDDFQSKKASERVSKLRQLSEKLKTHQPIEQNLYEIENIPAYKRRNVELSDVTPSSESQISDYAMSENPDKSIELRSENKFLNKKVD
jgi:cell division protein FtsZ